MALKFLRRPALCLLLAALGVAPVLLAGCASGIVDEGWQPMRPLGAELDTLRPATDAKVAVADGPVVAEESAGPLSLRQALVLAMLHSPELAGASWEVRSAEARAIQASLLPNPEIGFSLETIVNPRTVTSILSLGQVIFLSDKWSRQKQVAMLDRDMAGWDWEAQRVRVYSETAKAFVSLVAAQERLALAEEIVSVSQKMVNTTAERVRAGKAPPLEEMRAKVELGTVRAELEQARHAVLAARYRLAAMWGSTSPKFDKAEGVLALGGDIPSAEQVFCLLEQNPDVARWTTEMQRRQAVVVLERRKAIPDLTVSGGGKWETGGGRGFVAGASIPIPIFDRNQGGIAESRFDVAKGYEEQRAAKARVLAEIADAYGAMASAYARSAILGAEVVPEAQKAFDAATAGYEEGKFSYLDVLDAQRTVFDVRVQHLEALTECLIATADVEGLVGQSIESISEIDTATQENLEK